MTRARFIESFGFAAQGVASTFREGRNFKVQLCFAVAAIALGVAFSIDLTEWAIIAVCIGTVLGLECVNTAVEAVVDIASPQRSELAKLAKDSAAGAVLIASVASLFVAAFLFLPRIVSILV